MVAIGRVAPRRIHPAAFLAAVVALAAATYLVHPSIGGPAKPASTWPASGAGDVARSSAAAGSIAPVPAPGSGASGGDIQADGTIAQLDHSIGLWTVNLRRNPDDFLSATNLSLLYHARGRLTADLDDYGRALEAARTALVAAPGYAPARALEATVQLSLHEFPEALATASSLYRDDPSQIGALATMADAELELGRYPEARTAYREVASRAPGPAIDARLARLAFLGGDDTLAIKLARQARDEAVSAARADGDPRSGDLVFYQYQLAEMARLTGDGQLARESYDAALAIRDDDLGSLVGLARIDANQGRPGAAIAGLRRAAAIAPQPETLALLGDLLSAGNDQRAAMQQFATVRAIRSLSEVAGSVYDRQLLLFELDHGGASPEILDHARTALAARADIYGHDVVAWAHYRLGRVNEAKTEMAAAMSQGTVDPRLLYHAGAIAIAAGDRAGGAAQLRRAVMLSTGLDPAQLAEANALLKSTMTP